MVSAYLLLQAETGAVKQTLDEVAADPGIAWAEPVTGPYDVIAAVQGSPRDVLDRLELGSVTRTITCPVGRS